MVRIGIKGLEKKWVRKTGLFSVELNQLKGSYSINGSVSMSPEAEKAGTVFTIHTDFASSFKYFVSPYSYYTNCGGEKRA